MVLQKVIDHITKQLKGEHLKARCARGSLTLGAGIFFERGLRFVRYVVIAKVLLREDLGLMALAIASTMGFEALSQVGLKEAVIQNKQGTNPEYLNVAWWFQMIRAFVLFAVAFMAAPLISYFYEDPRLLLMRRVAFVGMIFHGLLSPRTFVLQKELRFNKAVLLVQGSGLLGTFVTIMLVVLWQNIWGVVFGFVIEAMAKCLLSFILCPFRPSLNFNRNHMRSLFRFIRGMIGLPILTFIAFQADIMVLGKLVSKELLGMYSMALILARMPRDLFARVLGSVLMPAI